MQTVAAAVIGLVICTHDGPPFAIDEVDFDGEACRIRIASSWRVDASEAFLEARSRYRAALSRLATGQDDRDLAYCDVDWIEHRARPLMSEFEESLEERTRAYGTCCRAVVTARCLDQDLEQLVSDWRQRMGRRRAIRSVILMVAPGVFAGLAAGLIYLDRRSLGDCRPRLLGIALLLAISAGLLINRWGWLCLW